MFYFLNNYNQAIARTEKKLLRKNQFSIMKNKSYQLIFNYETWWL